MSQLAQTDRSQIARENALYKLHYRTKKDGEAFYDPKKGRFVSFAMVGNERKIFECENISAYSPLWKKLPIYGTLFGSALSDFLFNECPDMSILDDIMELESEGQGRNYKGNGKERSFIDTFDTQKITFNQKKMIILGNVQSGKSKMMIVLATLFQSFGKSTIILLRDITIDRIQLVANLEKFAQRFKDFATTRNLLPENYTFNITCFDELAPIADIRKIVTASPKASICIAIANESTMEKISSQLQGNEKYVLFIDEVDLVDSKNALTRLPFLNNIKEKAELVVGVSASILGTAAEWNIDPRCIREISTPINYTGIDRIQAIEVDTGDNTTVKGEDCENIYLAVPALESYLKDFAERKNVTVCGVLEPEIDLLRISTEIAPQRAIRDEMIRKYPNVATLLCVESGIDIYHPCLGSTPIKTLDNKYKSKIEGKIHHFSGNVDVGSALAILQDKGIQKITHVMCIAGKKASRSVSFSSNTGGLARWHVRRMFVKLSQGTSLDEVLQIAGRVCGIFQQNLTQYIYASKTDLETIKNAYFSQQDLLNNTSRKYGKMVDGMVVEKSPHTNENTYKIVKIWKLNADVQLESGMNNLLNESEMSKWKLTVDGKTPTGRVKKIAKRLTMRDSVNPKLVENDGRESKEDYKFEKDVIIPKVEEKKEEFDEKEGECFLIKPETLAKESRE